MTRRRSRDMLRVALLNEEEKLYDLKAALAALTIMASAPDGIEADDMPGLRYVAGSARELADALHHAWRDAVGRLVP